MLALSRSKPHRILTQSEVRLRQICYYVERWDPEFEKKVIEVLHAYKYVEIVNAGLVEGTLKNDEKPGIQALSPTAPDALHQYPSHLRDYEPLGAHSKKTQAYLTVVFTPNASTST